MGNAGNQFGGIHIDAPQIVSSLSFATVKDYEDYIARLQQFPRVFNETMIQMRNGMRDGLMPPRILLVQVAEQTEGIAKQKAEDTPFALPPAKFPKEFSQADRDRLRDRRAQCHSRSSVTGIQDVSDFCARYLRAERPHDNRALGIAAGKRALCAGSTAANDNQHAAGGNSSTGTARSGAD